MSLFEYKQYEGIKFLAIPKHLEPHHWSFIYGLAGMKMAECGNFGLETTIDIL